MKRSSRIATAISIASAIALSNTQGASAQMAVNDGGGGALVTGDSALQSFYNNPIVSGVTVSIANKATNTPTVVSSVVTATKNAGGISQIIPTAIVVVRMYAVPVTLGILAFFSGMANG